MLLLNTEGGIVCDPIILRLEKNKFWIFTPDCDLELWIKGAHVNSGLNVNIHDANVSLYKFKVQNLLLCLLRCLENKFLS